MITSENIVSGAQLKDFFISRKSHVPLLRYSNFDILNHFINFKNLEVVMYSSHEIENIIEYIFTIHILNFWICTPLLWNVMVITLKHTSVRNDISLFTNCFIICKEVGRSFSHKYSWIYLHNCFIAKTIFKTYLTH